MNISKEQLRRWYIEEKLSYRNIMERLGINNARKMKLLLEEADIEIRRGSDAVKTQWENNVDRRVVQGKIFAEAHKGKPSPRRKSEIELKEILFDKGLIYRGRRYVGGYTYMEYVCPRCGRIGETSLRALSGCPVCAIEEQHNEQRLPFNKVKKVFQKAGLILLAKTAKSNNTPLPFICPYHIAVGIQYRTYEKARDRNGCKYCTYDNWERTTTTENEKIRRSWRMDAWRKAVFERDGYTCQKCGDNKGGNLQAHHIENFSTNTTMRFNVENGITLCQKCHDPVWKNSFHFVYGTHNNTREQVEEFLGEELMPTALLRRLRRGVQRGVEAGDRQARPHRLPGVQGLRCDDAVAGEGGKLR